MMISILIILLSLQQVTVNIVTNTAMYSVSVIPAQFLKHHLNLEILKWIAILMLKVLFYSNHAISPILCTLFSH